MKAKVKLSYTVELMVEGESEEAIYNIPSEKAHDFSRVDESPFIDK